MAAAIGQTGDLAPLVRGGIKPVAGADVDLRLVVTVIASQRIHLSFEHRCADMTARIRQFRFVLPGRASVERQAPVLTSVRIAIRFVAAEVMQVATNDRQATARAWFRQRRSDGPRVSSNVILPDFIGDRPRMFPRRDRTECSGSLRLDATGDTHRHSGINELRGDSNVAHERRNMPESLSEIDRNRFTSQRDFTNVARRANQSHLPSWHAVLHRPIAPILVRRPQRYPDWRRPLVRLLTTACPPHDNSFGTPANDHRTDLSCSAITETLEHPISTTGGRYDFPTSSFCARSVSCPHPGAIGFDWFTIDAGGVPWLISRPR